MRAQKKMADGGIITGSAIRNITDWDDEIVVGQSSAGVSSIQSFELCEDPSFWKDHNVQVTIRMRPLSNNEMSVQGNSKCVRQESCLLGLDLPRHSLTFDLVADENVSQTGSGKTHTMLL
ncbi:hypothetical protein P8452_32122 [Trifolium repens]|nr:hypothetical protein P8452_32122 [Trifolium repens]